MPTRHRLAALAAILAAMAVAACSGSGAAPSRGALTNQTPAPVATAAPSAAFAGAVLHVAGTPIDVVSTGAALWVSDIHADAVVHLDPTTFGPLGTVAIGSGEGPAYMASVGSNLFVSNNNGQGVTRIDALTGKATGVAAPDAVTCCLPIVVGGALWIPSDKGLLRIDPASLKVSATIDVGDRPDGLTTDGTHVFGTNDTGNVWSVDIATNTRADLKLAGFPVGMSGGMLWVAKDKTLLGVDPVTGAVSVTIPVGMSYDAVTINGTLAWVLHASTLVDDSSILKVDLAGQKVAGTPVTLPGLAPSMIRQIDGALWLPSFDGGSVIRLPVW